MHQKPDITRNKPISKALVHHHKEICSTISLKNELTSHKSYDKFSK